MLVDFELSLIEYDKMLIIRRVKFKENCISRKAHFCSKMGRSVSFLWKNGWE